MYILNIHINIHIKPYKTYAYRPAPRPSLGPLHRPHPHQGHSGILKKFHDSLTVANININIKYKQMYNLRQAQNGGPTPSQYPKKQVSDQPHGCLADLPSSLKTIKIIICLINMPKNNKDNKYVSLFQWNRDPSLYSLPCCVSRDLARCGPAHFH